MPRWAGLSRPDVNQSQVTGLIAVDLEVAVQILAIAVSDTCTITQSGNSL